MCYEITLRYNKALKYKGVIVKTVDEMIADIIRREGKFSNHKNDKGGPTQYGITLETLRKWRLRDVTIDDVKALTILDAADIYKNEYYYRPHIDKLPAQLQPVVFDMAVNMGPKQAIKIFQAVIDRYWRKTSIDGIIGPVTIKSAKGLANFHDDNFVIEQITEERIKFYRNIVKRDPSQIVFLNGWENRAREFLV